MCVGNDVVVHVGPNASDVSQKYPRRGVSAEWQSDRVMQAATLSKHALTQTGRRDEGVDGNKRAGGIKRGCSGPFSPDAMNLTSANREGSRLSHHVSPFNVPVPTRLRPFRQTNAGTSAELMRNRHCFPTLETPNHPLRIRQSISVCPAEAETKRNWAKAGTVR